jgi:hypothetical protein
MTFPLQIKEFNSGIIHNTECYLPINLKENDENDEIYNITCKIKGTDSCPIIPPDKDITIISNPGYRIINSKVINFINFTGKSTIITFTAGNIYRHNFDKRNKIYYFGFNRNTIDYKLNDDISFNINYKIKENGNETENTTSCILNKDSNNIICVINNVESENVNIKIIKNPKDDISSINKKTIIFKNFENKKIKVFVAGKIQKGNCTNRNRIYSFSFIDSKSIIETETIKNPIKFVLKMIYPEKYAICTINVEDLILSNDVNCTIEGVNECPVEYNKDIIVGDIEPESIQDGNSIIYFSSFAGQNTFDYKVSIENLLKSKITEDCKYYFKFS